MSGTLVQFLVLPLSGCCACRLLTDLPGLRLLIWDSTGHMGMEIEVFSALKILWKKICDTVWIWFLGAGEDDSIKRAGTMSSFFKTLKSYLFTHYFDDVCIFILKICGIHNYALAPTINIYPRIIDEGQIERRHLPSGRHSR